MQCGPAPLAAIKKGHIYIGYDTGFVFAEVNADRVEWIVKQEGSYPGGILFSPEKAVEEVSHVFKTAF